jgi:hypothetical protein
MDHVARRPRCGRSSFVTKRSIGRRAIHISCSQAAIAVALMPWNLALWLQAKRLRLAIEMDCDARVLRVHPSPERYGLLMLTIAQRRSIAPMFAPMLSEPTSQLERRIVAMRTTTRKVARATVVGGTTVAVSVLRFACALQSDNPISPKPRMGVRSLQRGPLAVSDSQTYFEFQVEKAVSVAAGNPRPEFPPSLRGRRLSKASVGAVRCRHVRPRGHEDVQSSQIRAMICSPTQSEPCSRTCDSTRRWSVTAR